MRRCLSHALTHAAAQWCTAGLLSALALPPALAQAPAPLPDTHTAGAVQYRCGGIGREESDAMRAAMPQHKLSLLMARSDGAYLADVDVQLQGPSGAARFTADGPVCLLDLPDGPYTVTTTSPDGRSQRHSAQVGACGQVLHIRD